MSRDDHLQSTCGCTVPTKPTEPIMPGMTGKIDVKYNMNPGPIRKTITVESNAINVEGGKIALKIKGDVILKPEVNILEKKKTFKLKLKALAIKNNGFFTHKCLFVFNFLWQK